MQQDFSHFFLSYLNEIIKTPSGQAYSICPFHNDTVKSFSVNLRTGLWTCHKENIHGNVITFAKKLGIDPPEQNGLQPVIPPSTSPVLPNKKILLPKKQEKISCEKLIKTYEYQYENNEPAFRVLRFEPKSFRQERFENGRWISGTKGIRKVLYRLPRIISSRPNSMIFLVEGEKDADRLESLGLVATTSPMGANNWRTEYAGFFKDKYVVIIPDNDEAGIEFTKKAAQDIKLFAKSIKLLSLNGVQDKGDVSDYLDNNGNRVEPLLDLVRKSPLFGEIRVPDESPEKYFSGHRIFISDGAMLLPGEYRKYAKDAINQVIRKCEKSIPENIYKKLDQVDNILKKIKFKNQYEAILKILMEVHYYSTLNT